MKKALSEAAVSVGWWGPFEILVDPTLRPGEFRFAYPKPIVHAPEGYNPQDIRPVTVGWRLDAVHGGHCDVSIFVGRNQGARGRAGTIVLRIEEWQELSSSGAIEVIESMEGAEDALAEAVR